jgi:co-chaperonin GroES (HSP10)
VTDTLKPLNGHVLAKMTAQAEERTAGGIIVPATVHGRPRHARVEALGDANPLGLSPGDAVVIDPYKIACVLADGDMAQTANNPLANHGDLFLIHEDHILAVVPS